MFKLRDGETVVTAFAETASGPGWSNQLVWVIIQDINSQLRQECLQPEEQSPAMVTLHHTSAAAHRAMSVAVVNLLKARA